MAKIIRAQRVKRADVQSVPKKSAKKAPAKAQTKKAKAKMAKPAKTGPARPAKAPKLTPWTPEQAREASARFQKANPEPKGELEHLNPFTLLVAVVLSAQATDAGVNKATRALFQVADTPHKMLALGEDKVREYVKPIGLYRNKAKHGIALSEKLIA